MIEVLKSKTPKIQMEDECGKFILMENNNFEAKYKNGYRCSYRYDKKIIKIKT